MHQFLLDLRLGLELVDGRPMYEVGRGLGELNLMGGRAVKGRRKGGKSVEDLLLKLPICCDIPRPFGSSSSGGSFPLLE